MTLMVIDTTTEDKAEQSVACRAADRAFPEVHVTRGGRVNSGVELREGCAGSGAADKAAI